MVGKARVPILTLNRITCIVIGSLLISCSSGGPNSKTASRSASVAAFVDLGPLEISSKALAAARAKGSVHVVSVGRQENKSIHLEGDAGNRAGTQSLIFGNQRSEIILVSGIAFVRSNRAALAGIYGFSSATATRYANRWLSYSSSDSGYDQISRGITMRSLLDELSLAAPLSKTAVKTIRGQQAIGINGKDKDGVNVTLYVGVGGDHLPIQLVASRGGGVATVDFSGWGKKVSVQAPPGATKASGIEA